MSEKPDWNKELAGVKSLTLLCQTDKSQTSGEAESRHEWEGEV